MTRRKRVAIWLAAAAAVLGLAAVLLVPLGVQMWKVHQLTSDWLLTPKAIPSKVQFAHRDFNCGPNPKPHGRTLDGLTVQGKTVGGEDIYAEHPANVTFIAFRTAEGVITCDLMGGP